MAITGVVSMKSRPNHKDGDCPQANIKRPQAGVGHMNMDFFRSMFILPAIPTGAANSSVVKLVL